MAAFELRSSSCDGHIRALSRAIIVASKISKEALLEFTADKLRLCARTDIFMVKFTFNRDFFTEYRCDKRRRCFVYLKALTMPFKSSILMADKDGSSIGRSAIRVRCTVEDEIYNRIVFKIGAEPPATTLTYNLNINDLDPDRMSELNVINRSIDYARVEIAPKQNKKERFLLSAFNNFAPDIDQITIKTSMSEVKFIGSTSPLYINRASITTSEFTHRRDDFSIFQVKEDVSITVPLRYLKVFLNFVETNKVQTFPTYIFEGMGLPAHFVYDAQLFKAHFISATQTEYLPEELADEHILAIGAGPDESFLLEENVIDAQDDLESYDDRFVDNEELGESEYDGYNENQSDGSGHLDGNLEGLGTPTSDLEPQVITHGMHATHSNYSDSVRSELRTSVSVDPAKLREAIDLAKGLDPDEVEKMIETRYSDSDDSFSDEDR